MAYHFNLQRYTYNDGETNMNYTCRKCRQLKDNNIEPYDYWLDGVICPTCKVEEEEEEEEEDVL